MQFLIFVFILLSLLSSLKKKGRRIRRKEPFFDPWSFGEEPPEDRTEDALKNIVETTDMGSLKLAKEPKIEEAEKHQDVTEDSHYIEEDEKFEPLPKQEKAGLFIPSLLLDEEGEKGTARALDPTNSEQVLKGLLLGRQLPLAIVASEILGPPRAFRPIRKRLFK